ncbi:MAG: hypothetical protein QOE70_3044 [Chthoniobacter sp.]|jgi:uncharacterized lipoprotein YddW (UPF0748 family)|nr:hypothetical protein [Chthoniobacter sp.]
MRRSSIWTVILLAICCAAARGADEAPEPMREFRAAWVATVGNIDWPSKAGLPVNDQKAELRAILERSVLLKMNAIILQVRPACDAFYDSQREPWSPYLTGTMGLAPEPGYDPLEFAIAEAHLRGLELHAWFNPFRALTSASAPVSSNHVTRTHPEWVRRYGGQLWLDPGEPNAREFSLATILDVVRRYDIDGVHIDDYFYPYPTPARTPFPDDASWRRYREGGGTLERDDWRRDNNNQLVEQLYTRVKELKRGVKVGISPFGIWRPGNPTTIIAGLDAYGELYADSRRWLQEGWCDYFSPQLYWSIAPKKQSFPVLLSWWAEQNKLGRHLWPGIATERIGPARPIQEILNQIELTRTFAGSHGHVHWNHKALMRDKGGIVEGLREQSYPQFAMVPASPWLGVTTLPKPVLESGGGRLSWRLADGRQPRWWLVQARQGETWASQLVPGTRSSGRLPDAEAISLRAVDAAGNLGEPIVLRVR